MAAWAIGCWWVNARGVSVICPACHPRRFVLVPVQGIAGMWWMAFLTDHAFFITHTKPVDLQNVFVPNLVDWSQPGTIVGDDAWFVPCTRNAAHARD